MAPPRPTITDEDLDDLDDIVTTSSTTQNPPSTTTQPSNNEADDFPDPDEAPPLDDEALAAELQKGLSSLFEGLDENDELQFKEMMDKLMRGEPLPGLGGAPGSAPATATEGSRGPTDEDSTEFNEDEMMKMLAAMGAGGGGLAGGIPNGLFNTESKGKAREGATTTATAPPAAPVNFQDAIKASLSKVKESNSTIDQETSAKNAAGGDPFAAMMAQMAGLEGGEEGLQGMLDEMMGQLMSREVLYEPLKELSEKYPSYLATNEATLSEEDRKRYNTQAEVVAKIVAKYEEPGADKSEESMTALEKEQNTQRQQEITDLIAKMNDCGAPPKEIMGEMPPGMELGGDGIPKMPEDCIIS